MTRMQIEDVKESRAVMRAAYEQEIARVRAQIESYNNQAAAYRHAGEEYIIRMSAGNAD